MFSKERSLKIRRNHAYLVPLSWIVIVSYRSSGGGFGLGEVQHLDVLLSGYRGLGEHLLTESSGEKAYGCAIGLLFEPNRGCCCLVVAVVRHDAHLSVSSHLFGMPGLWKARGKKMS
ncbi:hypothetical protein EVAR_70896_1 [Eumeta japonica]|uniref:Uncharacterized protein n=1 Tax=Eumeta variegata TaxID=151549 RepID=A0A4C1TDQ7_EUMVA|nr:hypothetical protein EVAR_70896_1 [Eumeta japonica]